MSGLLEEIWACEIIRWRVEQACYNVEACLRGLSFRRPSCIACMARVYANSSSQSWKFPGSCAFAWPPQLDKVYWTSFADTGHGIHCSREAANLQLLMHRSRVCPSQIR
jgi:hypothetical protein